MKAAVKLRVPRAYILAFPEVLHGRWAEGGWVQLRDAFLLAGMTVAYSAASGACHTANRHADH